MASYRIHHRTIYTYRYPVTASHHTAILKPLSDEAQSCERFTLAIQPEDSDLIERQDYFGNTAHLFSIQEPHDSLTVDANSSVTTNAKPIDLQNIDTSSNAIREILADISRTDLIAAKEFLHETDHTPKTAEVFDFGARFFANGTPFGEGILAFLEAFKTEFEFDPEATDIYTPIQETLASKRGVCQDFSHLMISALRAQGFAARYVSGYILTMPPPGMPRLVGADASHAWVSVYLPDHGWVDIDPTNNRVCGDQHVRVAYGRDFSDVSMLKGAVTGGGEHSIKVEVTMVPA